MSAQPRNPGAAAIARLSELPPLERRVIRCLRLWSAAPDGVGALRRELAPRHGAAAAEALVDDLAALIGTTVRHARRPLLAHAPDCPCAGADECVFARFVALAAEGAREDAVLIAALMVRADLALCVAGLAETIGLGLMRDQAPRVIQ
jgi:hypothetical protein